MIELTPNFNLNNIKKIIINAANRIDNVIRDRMMIVGDQFVINARNNGNYQDQTGNLRSSIGYILFKDGEAIGENFEESKKGTDRKTGLAKARDLAYNFEDIPDSGYCLVCIAGMEYAAAVQSLDGYDVIASSSLIAERELRESFKRLENKLNKQ